MVSLCVLFVSCFVFFFFFFNDTATTEIYTLSLHDALPISLLDGTAQGPGRVQTPDVTADGELLGKPPSKAKYVVVETGIDPDGAFITKHGHAAGGGTEWWRLYKIRPPLRLLGAATGLFA